jgi:hypothetical protein
MIFLTVAQIGCYLTKNLIPATVYLGGEDGYMKSLLRSRFRFDETPLAVRLLSILEMSPRIPLLENLDFTGPNTYSGPQLELFLKEVLDTDFWEPTLTKDEIVTCTAIKFQPVDDEFEDEEESEEHAETSQDGQSEVSRGKKSEVMTQHPSHNDDETNNDENTQDDDDGNNDTQDSDHSEDRRSRSYRSNDECSRGSRSRSESSRSSRSSSESEDDSNRSRSSRGSRESSRSRSESEESTGSRRSKRGSSDEEENPTPEPCAEYAPNDDPVHYGSGPSDSEVEEVEVSKFYKRPSDDHDSDEEGSDNASAVSSRGIKNDESFKKSPETTKTAPGRNANRNRARAVRRAKNRQLHREQKLKAIEDAEKSADAVEFEPEITDEQPVEEDSLMAEVEHTESDVPTKDQSQDNSDVVSLTLNSLKYINPNSHVFF